MNHRSQTLASNFDMSFVNRTIKQIIAKKKTDVDFLSFEKPGKGNLNKSTDEEV